MMGGVLRVVRGVTLVMMVRRMVSQIVIAARAIVAVKDLAGGA